MRMERISLAQTLGLVHGIVAGSWLPEAFGSKVVEVIRIISARKRGIARKERNQARAWLNITRQRIRAECRMRLN